MHNASGSAVGRAADQRLEPEEKGSLDAWGLGGSFEVGAEQIFRQIDLSPSKDGMVRQAERVLLGRMPLTATAYPLRVQHERMWDEYMLRHNQRLARLRA